MSVTKVQLVGNVSPGAVFAGIVTATSLSVGNAVGINSTGINVTGIISATSLSVGGQKVSSLGVGINTAGGSVGTGATVLDFRGSGISTVTVSLGIGTIFIQGGGGASVTTSDTAPVSPSDGDLWYDSVGGRLYVYYDDGNTNQWVDAAPQGGGNASAAKLEVSNTKAEVTDTGSNGTFTVTTEGTGRLSVDSSGRTLLGGVTANANGGVLQLSSGITFPATAVAASDANTLDDYEEGTFTPSLGDSAGGVATMSVQEGKYVKVGKIVQFSFQVVWTAKNTWTGTNTKISGLPFAATSNTGAYYWTNPAAMSCNLTTTAFNYAIEANQTFGYIMTLLIGSIGASDFPSSGRAIINGVYQTA